jgi:hypothetical protein
MQRKRKKTEGGALSQPSFRNGAFIFRPPFAPKFFSLQKNFPRPPNGRFYLCWGEEPMCVYFKKNRKDAKGLCLRKVRRARSFLCDLGVSFAPFAVNSSGEAGVSD